MSPNANRTGGTTTARWFCSGSPGITDGGITENFLIRSLKGDLDDWVRDRTDASIFNKKADQVRADMERIVADPLKRDRWRESLANVNPKYASWTDK